MKHVKVLDCTLRDGAYLVDKKFDSEVIEGVINGLVKSRIDIIEIGFFQDERIEGTSTAFLNSAEAKKYIPVDKEGGMFTVLADFSRYSIENLDECSPESVDAVRACFFKQERKEAINFFREIVRKGYKLFIQPVDIMGYDDYELLDLLHDLKNIEVYSFSIVDTFGSMYIEDLRRIYSLVHTNLNLDVQIGFHSHNNLQMSNALSQEFANISFGQREVVIDATLLGMGRGAGNTPTELIVDYLNKKWNHLYIMDEILDVIDAYIEPLKVKCTWGYSTSYFIAGSYSAHVNNISYLKQKSGIASKGIRHVLNDVGKIERKRYNYQLLEETYINYLTGEVEDANAIEYLRDALNERNVLILAPGKSVQKESKQIVKYIQEKNPIVIAVNFYPEEVQTDFVYFNNIKRFNSSQIANKIVGVKKIIVSNVKKDYEEDEIIISMNRLIKPGWNNMDNSVVLLLRLLDYMAPNVIGIAGMDGYTDENNYFMESMEVPMDKEEAERLNMEISEMLVDYKKTRNSEIPVKFITHSCFESII